jgi:hypothetical protein
MFKIQNKTDRGMYIKIIEQAIRQEWSVMIDLPQKELL